MDRRYRGFVTHVQDVGRFPLMCRPDDEAEVKPVAPRLRRWLVAAIHCWEEWQLLLNRIQREPAGLVSLVDRDDPRLNQEGRGEEKKETLRTPVKSDDFLKPFQDTLADAHGELIKLCHKAMEHHSEELKATLDGMIGPARVPLLAKALDRDGSEVGKVLQPIHMGIGPGWLTISPPKTPPPSPDTAPDDYDRWF
ncbi:hypothetical protein, partial [Zavarzinella formosa]|uniref:hypothetical protein n=1 Tax=Zavarzinella formosa TaxID=360055 RepID=UPI0012F91C78